jgi:hypothetical protein
MSDLPPGWARAEANYLEDPRGLPSICDDCEHADGCELDPTDCEADACERAAEDRWEARRDAYD